MHSNYSKKNSQNAGFIQDSDTCRQGREESEKNTQVRDQAYKTADCGQEIKVRYAQPPKYDATNHGIGQDPEQNFRL